ncbi:MAG: M20 family metallo-hydrolase [Proteobacteria bacterium]|nr:M20 family metallo-hydrolase [Pseudomonadota bacterium]
MKPWIALLLLPSLAAAAPPGVDGARLVGHLEALSAFGRNPEGGVSRVAYSEADRAGREYVLGLMRAAGLEASIDAAGNLVGRRAGRTTGLRPIVIGSHIDSVPSGGNYDGDVGSLAAIEVAQVLRERGIALRHPLEVIVFSNEEGVMLGSGALAGTVDAARLDSVSQSGRTVRDGVRFIGGDPERLEGVRREPGSIAGYLELHIEQGAVLDREHVPIGVVEGIVGILDSEVVVDGFANHAGTTPMAERHDALLSAARFIEAVHATVTGEPGRQVGTVGWVRAEPGAYNVVPGRVTLGLEIRDLDTRRIEALFAKIRAGANEIGRRDGTAFRFQRTLLTPGAPTDPSLQALIAASAARLGLASRPLPSGAGHDAQEMARLGPIGMIFIPSVDGISHSPRERSRPAEIENGANVLLESLRALDDDRRR